MMRLDRLVGQLNIASRTEAKKIIRKHLVKVDGIVVDNPDAKVDEDNCVITYNGKEYIYQKYRYFMLNKPSGIVSANKDNLHKTVMDLFAECTGLSKEEYFCVGRLDIDTVGLLIITNDGNTAHKTLSPSKHVDKTYYLKAAKEITSEDLEKLSEGIEIEDGVITAPAEFVFEENSTDSGFLTISEGKFHQVKRMFLKISNEVVFLKRVSFGPIRLDDDLKEGQVRELTEEERNRLVNV